MSYYNIQYSLWLGETLVTAKNLKYSGISDIDDVYGSDLAPFYTSDTTGFVIGYAYEKNNNFSFYPALIFLQTDGLIGWISSINSIIYTNRKNSEDYLQVANVINPNSSIDKITALVWLSDSDKLLIWTVNPTTGSTIGTYEVTDALGQEIDSEILCKVLVNIIDIQSHTSFNPLHVSLAHYFVPNQ